MSKLQFPRLSEARDFLPFIRAELAAAAVRHSLPAGFSLDLLPIVEPGVFGYEFQPDREACDYLTIGRDYLGRPLLRRSLYCPDATAALRLAAVNGRVLSDREVDPWWRIQHRDLNFPDWTAAAEAIWSAFDALFPDVPRTSVAISDGWQRDLDDALAIAHAHLAAWDPCIEFCGVPDEANYGYALIRDSGESGQLSLRAPGQWALRWESPPHTLGEQWSAAPRDDRAERAWAVSGAQIVDSAPARTLPVPAASTATFRQPR